ncbi:hypothetical protein COCSUDRAFT_41457 [Coccomyxa subellipsoidea C-169]|uniref:Endopeptidase S2P n=1 Tax=Coccomyxa subellipsoidea (strain C-169) TaxID=574566 RepID=I0Z0K0_COCSC|nr:hypothetical protein COCSUDRAFT_41457 [Coccomyxa subellipsoidea C-169]EIE24169.1 hypothetical protein COCSUDRAFT_41457 [Coccomyxa subellipsoidea C-169]|eukprot:XP_005648713.1 hypothetical protein COCSUDRAFT_41457 [Coccomyxa subellipsoidea C-169]
MHGPLLIATLLWLSIYAASLLIKRGIGVRGLSIGWCSITFCTAHFNRIFYNIGRKHNRLLRQWFGMGTIAAGMLGISVTFIFMQELWQVMRWLKEVATDASPDPQLPAQAWSLGVALPGLTVPWGHAVYLWIATALSLGVHEAGHALAAAAEGVGIHHMAVFLVLLLPGAYVALDTDTLTILNPLRSLRVICAGVWHNAVLCCMCWVVALSLPWILSPGYSIGNGAVVRQLSEASPVGAYLSPGDMILSVNQCPVKGSRDGEGRPKQDTQQDKQDTSMHTVRQGPAAVEQAAQRQDGLEGGGFEGQEQPLPEDAVVGVCLPARTAAGHRACTSTQGTPQKGSGCARNAACMVPVLLPGDHMFKVCYSRDRKGKEAAAGKMTDFSPKAGWILTGLPHVIEQMLAYLFNVSAALALINMAPVFYFDGQAALEAVLGLQGGVSLVPAQRSGGHRWRLLLYRWALRLGTAAFAAILVMHAVQLAGFEASLRKKFAYARRAINFAIT